MATDHSTETTVKLLKAIRQETDTLWVLCVDLSIQCTKVLRCVLLERNKMNQNHGTGTVVNKSELASSS